MLTRDEFPGNVMVTISETEVRIWVCNETGCKFRIKAMGNVIRSGGPETHGPLDVIVQQIE